MFGRSLKGVGNPTSAEKAEEPLITVGWLCTTATLLLALLLAAYASI